MKPFLLDQKDYCCKKKKKKKQEKEKFFHSNFNPIIKNTENLSEPLNINVRRFLRQPWLRTNKIRSRKP